MSPRKLTMQALYMPRGCCNTLLKTSYCSYPCTNTEQNLQTIAIVQEPDFHQQNTHTEKGSTDTIGPRRPTEKVGSPAKAALRGHHGPLVRCMAHSKPQPIQTHYRKHQGLCSVPCQDRVQCSLSPAAMQQVCINRWPGSPASEKHMCREPS